MTIYTSHDDSIHRTPPERPKTKLCLSIDMDDQSLGHVVIESSGTRLLVDDGQARKLATLLNEHLMQRADLGDQVALNGINMLALQLEKYRYGNHCSEQAPPANGPPLC